MRCLVIEDESITGHYICNGLKEAGHTPTLVRDGVSGLQLATSQSWDVVVLDRMLPGGVDGLSLLTKIRELGKTTPVLILSALASLDERLRGLRVGGDDYLTKPFAFSELLARLEALPRRNTMRTESSELRIADLKLDLRTRRVEQASRLRSSRASSACSNTLCDTRGRWLRPACCSRPSGVTTLFRGPALLKFKSAVCVVRSTGISHCHCSIPSAAWAT